MSFQERLWRREHSGGWRTEIEQTDEDNWDGYVVHPNGMRTGAGAGTNRGWVEQRIALELADCGHTCGAECDVSMREVQDGI